MSEKTYNKCEDCRKYYECDSAFEWDVACDGFKSNERTVFDRITTSEEVLAPYFVRADFDEPFLPWFSTLTNESFETHEQAIAATVAKLNEVEK